MKSKADPGLRTRALQCLARREYSRAELRLMLLSHQPRDGERNGAPFDNAPAEDLDALLDDLTRCGWLSDQRAAAQLVHARRGRYGVQRIAHELRQRGIDEALIAGALPELKASEAAAAHDVWQKKFGVLAQDEKEKARQARFLQSRGFSMDAILKVLCGKE